jgi:hypothetical protein
LLFFHGQRILFSTGGFIPNMGVRSLFTVAALAVGTLSACSGDETAATAVTTVTLTATTPTVSSDRAADDTTYPNIVSVEATFSAGKWTFDVTVSSPYDTPQRYADGWRVTGTDGSVYGEHTLGHDHANEQPFTRTQPNVVIPEAVDTVMVQGRDKANGYGGKSVTLTLKRP